MAHNERERGRLKIQFIMDNSKRKKVLSKRLPILLKKVRELAALCDVPACLLVYLPGEAQPVVWPSPEAALEVLRRYRDLHLGRFKNELDGLDFFKQMNEKEEAKVSRVQRKTRDEEIKLVLLDFLAGRRKSFDDLPTDFFDSMSCSVANKLNAVNARLQKLRLGGALPPHTSVKPPVPPPMVATPLQPQNDGDASMYLDGESSHGTYSFETLDAFDGIALPRLEEMRADFVQAGIFSYPLPNPSSLEP
jgi:hypothetical protein